MAQVRTIAEIDAFIARWSAGDGGQERANYAMFLAELCDVIGAPRPDQASHVAAANAYAFERAVIFRQPDGSASQGRIDLYTRGCFVLEAKQSRRPGADKASGLQGDLLAAQEELHERIDALVAQAYGWPETLAEEEVLARLVGLNAQRAAEEQRGLVRWLRPDHQMQRAGVAAPRERQMEAEPVAARAKEEGAETRLSRRRCGAHGGGVRAAVAGGGGGRCGVGGAGIPPGRQGWSAPSRAFSRR